MLFAESMGSATVSLYHHITNCQRERESSKTEKIKGQGSENAKKEIMWEACSLGREGPGEVV